MALLSADGGLLFLVDGRDGGGGGGGWGRGVAQHRVELAGVGVVVVGGRG